MVTTSEALYLAFLFALALERGFELALSHRNATRAFARGGVEVGRAHFRVMAPFHALFLVACGAETLLLHRRFPGALGWLALAGALGAQGLRYWAIAALGEQWNTRVIVVPGLPPVTRGPYRWVRHPNYDAVILEIACVPLIHGAWITALVFSLSNAALLVVRVRVEERALGESWARAFSHAPRFIPGGPRD
ncbi:MAG: hypothetical protein JST54_28055 [Deltaproteobacteria bacterium]|nr:hypothetical protein [Deltaproteobacteria bacterium]